MTDLSDDLYASVDFEHLYYQLKQVKKERQRFRLMKSRGDFTEQELKKYIDKYEAILERNEYAIFDQLMKHTDDHLLRIETLDQEDRDHLMDEKTKIKIVLEYYKQAVDKDNPARSALDINDDLCG